ncbi:helix-turn-helix domain-containing protein [Paenibacillus sp. 32O-W]|uniref:response regulator transcription factor n=1 Tax=Paenibacillus sp. 32O-W TaxID=1695218 RepID=UPI0011A12BF8|nr:helix-turn-helix domain-containing protein [Paenibacillus sp. 32O-W]
MLKVMLVDDDIPVLQFLERTIPWDRLQLQLTGMFENGLKAYEHVKQEPPDLLITDIGMPLMDGIQLIRLTKEINPDVMVIILSCHDDFKLAQQAIKLNVHDYLLKETIESETVVRLLEEWLRQQADKEASQAPPAAPLLHSHKQIMKEQFIRSTLYNPVWDVEEWLEQARQFSIQLQLRPYMPVLGYIDEYRTARGKFISEENCIFAVENVIEEILKPHEGTVLFRLSMQEILLLFDSSNSLKVNDFDVVRRSLKQIQFALSKYLKIHLSFVLGDLNASFKPLKDNILTLMKSKEQRFYKEHGSIYKHRPFPYAADDLYLHYTAAVEQFQKIVLERKTEDVEAEVDHWLEWIRQNHYNPEVVKEWFLKILLSLQIKFKSMQHFRTLYSQDVLHRIFLDIENIGALRAVVIDFLQEAIAFTSQLFSQPNRMEIWEAQRYVAMNLHRKVTLEEVAKHLHLNPSYFSRLYKKETGENFIEYVIRSKMEKAQELLDQSTRSIDNIADSLGYDNKSYFNKLFKNFSGMSPNDYRMRFQSH